MSVKNLIKIKEFQILEFKSRVSDNIGRLERVELLNMYQRLAISWQLRVKVTKKGDP